MNHPTHFLLQSKAERPSPDWRSSSYSDIGIKVGRSTWPIDSAALDARRFVLAKHLWSLYLDDLVFHGEFEKIEKSWLGAIAVLKLGGLMSAPAVVWGRQARNIQESYAVVDSVNRPTLEFVSFEKSARELRLVPVEFIPSHILVGFWQRGLRSHLQEFTPQSFIEKMRGFFARQNQRALAEAFAKKLTRMLSALAYRQKHGLNDYHLFSEKGRFSIAAQHQLLDRFPIIPDEATEFFKVLHGELIQHLEAGGVLQGRWGKLLMKGEGLVLRSDRRELPASSTKWKVAKVIE